MPACDEINNIPKQMKNTLLLLFFLVFTLQLSGQTIKRSGSYSDALSAQTFADHTIYYHVTAEGDSLPILWGLDLAWLSETNIRRGIAFMGKENVHIVRSSFTATSALTEGGGLAEDELDELNERLDIIDTYLEGVDVALNNDSPTIDDSFSGSPANWAALIDTTAAYHENHGHKVVTVSPLNEPDDASSIQGSWSYFYHVAGILRDNPRFDSTRISGANTLNTDSALVWYNRLADRLDEGNTHQLAGTFDNFAEFFETVRTNGDHATDDEMHNVMEAMVGAEYGMQTGIWWGTAEYARGEFVKASDGVRLGYSEDRDNWTAASVYRNTNGDVQAFLGASERQAYSTVYRFVSEDKPVFYDGYGPQRVYTMKIPGGTGYQKNQPNAERVINISWGEDVQPAIDGTYVLVNRNSGMVLEVADGSTIDGADIQQGSYNIKAYQHWIVTRIDPESGCDFSYYTFASVNDSDMLMDVYNYSLDDGGNVNQWTSNNGYNQQWYLEYAEDGWFYIRNRQSAKCLEVKDASITNAASIVQGELDESEDQQWRFLPVGVTIDFDAPAAPSDLSATSNAQSIKLNWTASSDKDVSGYTVMRAEAEDGEYNTIGRNISSTSFVDNSISAGETFYYKVMAMDSSLNHSDYSNSVNIGAKGGDALLVDLSFNSNARDTTENLNHGAIYGEVSYVDGVDGSAIKLDESTNFVQLPENITDHKELSISAWFYWTGFFANEFIFSFGNSSTQRMYLVQNESLTNLDFCFVNDDTDVCLTTTRLSSAEWTHVVITIGESGVKLYLNGDLAVQSSVLVSPKDLESMVNYIGCGISSNEEYYCGYIDDFRVYNYVISESQIEELSTDINNVEDENDNSLKVWPSPAIDILNISYASNNQSDYINVNMFDMQGNMVLQNSEYQNNGNLSLDISALPSGIYILKVSEGGVQWTKKVVVRH